VNFELGSFFGYDFEYPEQLPIYDNQDQLIGYARLIDPKGVYTYQPPDQEHYIKSDMGNTQPQPIQDDKPIDLQTLLKRLGK
jgi:hypothetical protein